MCNIFTNNKIQWTRVNNDTNGNPRYVCHFLNLNTLQENDSKFWDIHGMNTISVKYRLAIKRANKIGGRKFHNKQYGGGIVFSSYNLDDTERAILELMEKENESC